MEVGFNQETIGKQVSKKQVPAFVLGAGVTALGVFRCLGRAGVPVFGGFDFPQVERWSRWYRRIEVHTLRAQERANQQHSFYELLRSLHHTQAVLIPCSDNWAEWVGALPVDLQQRYLSAQPESVLHRQFLDKQSFKGLLEKFNISHPQTFLIPPTNEFTRIGKASLCSVSAKAGGICLPCGAMPAEQAPPEISDWRNYFLKPRDSQHFFKEYSKKAHRVTNADEANVLLNQCRTKGLDCILQEFIPGDARQYFYVEGYRSRQGKITALFARRRLRMYPVDFGNSTAMISIPLSEVDSARRALCGLLEEVNYRGIFSAEFKYDGRDGLSKLLEVNSRPWWYVEFASSCGLNIPLMYYLDALGLDVPEGTKYQEGKEGVYWYYDWQVYREEKRKNVWSTLLFWLRARHTLLVADDPMPALCFVSELIRKKWNRRKDKKKSVSVHGHKGKG